MITTSALRSGDSLDSLAQGSPNATLSAQGSPNKSGSQNGVLTDASANRPFLLVDNSLENRSGLDLRVGLVVDPLFILTRTPGAEQVMPVLNIDERGLSIAKIAQEALALAGKAQEQNLGLRVEVAELRLKLEQQDAQIVLLIKQFQELQSTRSAKV